MINALLNWWFSTNVWVAVLVTTILVVATYFSFYFRFGVEPLKSEVKKIKLSRKAKRSFFIHRILIVLWMFASSHWFWMMFADMLQRPEAWM